jgi:hypothetical protein
MLGSEIEIEKEYENPQDSVASIAWAHKKPTFAVA